MSAWLRRLRRDRLLSFTLISLALWGGWTAIRTPCHPVDDLSCGVYTDHFSHMNTARLFVSEGVRIWTEPLNDAGPALTDEQLAALPEDLRSTVGGPDPTTAVADVPGWPADKPFVSTWGNYPRLHPPGDLLVTAPVAALYSFTGLSFTGANKLLILFFLVYAHVAFYAFVKVGSLESLGKPVGFAAAAIVYGELVHWSLEGFYEPIVIVPLVLCARFLAQRRGIEALFAFAVAASLHFRALFFAPWALYAVYLIAREKQWLKWSRRQNVLAAATALLSSISLSIFALVWPYFHQLNIYNPVSLASNSITSPAVVTLVIVVVAFACVLVWARAWLDLAILAWVTAMLLLIRQAYEWEIVTFLAWLAAPVLVGLRDRWSSVRDVRLVATLFMGAFVFHNALMPAWIQRVVS